MSEPIIKLNPLSPESYSPKRPEILNLAEELYSEKAVDTVLIEGVEFVIVNKAKTFYAGAYSIAPDLESEPDIEGNWKKYHSDKQRIIDSVTPDCMICISINYTTPLLPCAMLHGQETTNHQQPEGINVFETPPSMFIKVESTEKAWALTKKLTGEDNPQWHMAPLFGLIKHIFLNDQYGYEYNSNGNHEIEYYYDNGTKSVAVPVKKK